VTDTANPFILNVGFIVHQTVGYSREFPFDFPFVSLPPDIRLENLSGYARVTRTAQGLLIQLKLTADTLVECARCLTEFHQPLVTDITDLYAFTTNSVTDSGLILPENGKINLTPMVRDEMLLSIPINPICQPDCKGLCPICGEYLNESTCNHDQVESDPRLETLRSLLE
jgi:uncharacterized protein